MGKLGTHEVATKIGDVEIRFETGKLAGQAGGSTVAHVGDTTLLVTSTASKTPKEHLDFFPLTVDFEEKMYSAGKIPGGFFKREGRASENAILTSRLVDRPMRPTFDNGLRNEIQILIMTLSADQVNPPDVLAINGASMATMLAGIPFDGPVAGVRMAMDRDGNWKPFPTFEYLETEAIFDLVVAGRLNSESGDIDILMVEAEATPNAFTQIEMGAKAPTEEVVGEALQEIRQYLKALCDLQLELVEQAGRREASNYPLFPPYDDKIFGEVERAVADELAAVFSDASIDKSTRNERVASLKEKAIDAVFDNAGDAPLSDEQLESQAKNAFRSVEKRTIRRRVVNDGVRIDGRGPKDIRELSAEVGVLPRAHGSGLFRRGETQVLNVLALGMTREAQRIDTIDPNTEKRYIHHYNFLPFSTGETGFMRGPKRREIGHGLLAERALLPVVPSEEEFPYALRVVSDVLSSNGSTSMGSVCGSTLALMDAGVPIKAPVAGIAMGLVYAEGKYTTLTDILGAEDAFGDMDFKVAGTSDFVTALQLDTKIDGLPADVLGQALQQAKEARLKILEVMKGAIAEPRPEVGGTAPKIISFEIPMDKIGEVIGPKGKVINTIQQETGADISVDDDGQVGTVTIGSKDGEAVAEARRRIELILDPPKAEVGAVYPGRVVNITKFGAFVNILPGRDGLLHISKIGGGKRIDRVEDVLNLGDEVEVRVDDIDPGGKVSLSLAGEAPAPTGGGDDNGGGGGASQSAATVSFEDSFEAELTEEFGDLGPAEEAGAGGNRGDRGGDRGGPRRRRPPRGPRRD